MASKSHTALLDLQDEDAEINLQFQDFGGPTANAPREDVQKDQTIYFNSFPDSAEDDQRQKLLGEDDDDDNDGSLTKSTHSFWTFEYYQQFFNVESKQVGDRIMWSMVPKPGVNFLQSYIRPNPDLYGPFWICITLVFTTAIAGNLSNYLQSSETGHWRYEFHKVTLATSSIFTYAWLVPLLIWGVLLWRGSKANISLLELICLYGYSLAIFVPVSLMWMVPLRWLQWCLGIVASVLSGSVLVRTIQPAVAHEAKKVALGLAVLILVLHFALAIGFMLYFFYPPTTTSFTNEMVSANQSSIHHDISNTSKTKDVQQKHERSEPFQDEIVEDKGNKPKEKEKKQIEVDNAGREKEVPIIHKPRKESTPKALSLVASKETPLNKNKKLDTLTKSSVVSPTLTKKEVKKEIVSEDAKQINSTVNPTNLKTIKTHINSTLKPNM